MAAQDFQFNFTNLNPVNTGWSASSLAAKLKTAQDATAAKAAADAANASVYGHVNKDKKGGGGYDWTTGIAGSMALGPAGLGLGAVGLFGSDGRTPAQKLDHQTKMLAKAEDKSSKTKNDVANAQHNIEALQAAIAKATDPAVIQNLQKELDKEQKSAGKIVDKLSAFDAHSAEIKNKITGLEEKTGTTHAGAAAPITTANYYNDLVDKSLASRQGISGWHGIGTGGTPLLNPEDVKPVVDPNKPVLPLLDPNKAAVKNPVYDPNTFGLNKKQIKKSGWTV